MKKAKILFVLLAAIFSACASEGSKEMASTTGPANPSYQSAPIARQNETKTATNPSVAGGGGGGGGGKTQDQIVTQQATLNQLENSQNQPTTIDRKIVRNADLQMESDAPEQSQQKITAIAEGNGGFVVESQQSSSDLRTATRDIVTMTVRVPSAKFSETLDEIRKTASRVVVETVKSDDVTDEFIDTEAQLKAKKALEAQFLEIMKRANTVGDALDVQRQLAEVRGEIEKLEGRRRFLENQASLSTIKIRLQAPATFSENSSGFGYRLKKAFGTGFDAALNFVLVLVSFVIAILPFLILIVLPIYLVVRYFIKKNRKQKTPRDIAKEELKVE